MTLKEYGSLSDVLAEQKSHGITDYRQYRDLRRYLSQKAWEQGVPLTGTFELTPLCNLDCKMCYVHLHSEQMQAQKVLSTDQWLDLQSQAIDAGMLYARLTGGECLLHPGFRRIYTYLQSRGVEVAILSNGLLMDEDTVEFLRANAPSGVQITLYGSSEDAYERVTGHRAFRRVLRNIDRLREAGIPLSIAVTPNRYGMDDIEPLLALIIEKGYAYAINSGLFVAREETGRALAEYDIDVEEYVRIFKTQARLKGQKLDAPDAVDLPDCGGYGDKEKRGVQCGAGRFAFSIAWDGAMHGCNMLRSMETYPLRDGFATAWKQLNTMAKEYPVLAECEGCAYAAGCKHCVAEHAQGAEIGHADPRICAWGRRMVEEGFVKLQDQH